MLTLNSMKLIAGTLITGLALPQVQAAGVPSPNVYDRGNRWSITYYDDQAGNHAQWATQIVCFLPYAVVGQSIQGAWYSLTFPDWNGRYYQEGDEVKMTGDYAADVGHDHMTLLHTTVDSGANPRGMAFKDWTEWREDGSYGNIIGWGNATLTREGKCPIPNPDLVIVPRKLTLEEILRFEAEADKFSFSLPPRLTLEGKEAELPGERGLESVDVYLERIGLQLPK